MTRTKHRGRAAPGALLRAPATPAERLEYARALHRRADADPGERAQNLTEAAEYYALAGHDETAEQLFRDAIADGGPVAGGAHGYYADFLFAHGRESEALAAVEQARKLRPTHPDTFMVIGETLDAHGRHADAARWLTTGLVRHCGELAGITADDLAFDHEISILAAARRRARANAALPPDHLDELAERYFGEIAGSDDGQDEEGGREG